MALVLVDTVILERDQRQEWLELRSHDRLEVRTRVRSLALPVALVGAGIGVAVGVSGSRHLCEAPITNFSPITRYCGISPALGAILYGVAGMGVGALIGGRFKSSVWEPLAPYGTGALRIAVAPLPSGGLVLAGSLTF